MNPLPSLRAVDPLGADALALLAQAAAEARSLYPELFTSDGPPPSNTPLGEGDVYLVAYDGAVPVACGALRRLDATSAELRRMFVAAHARRRGLARTMLAALEDAALDFGCDTLLLETGHRQQPAMGLYESGSSTRVAAFGAHVGDPTRLCHAKRLAPARG